jgi:hypothetical protein
MKFALRYCNTGRYVDATEAAALAQAAEAAGFVNVHGGWRLWSRSWALVAAQPAHVVGTALLV